MAALLTSAAVINTSFSVTTTKPHDPRKLQHRVQKYPHNSEFLDRSIDDPHDLEQRLNQVTFSNEDELLHFRIVQNAVVTTQYRGQNGLHQSLADICSSRFNVICVSPPGDQTLGLPRDLFVGLLEGLKISPAIINILWDSCGQYNSQWFYMDDKIGGTTCDEFQVFIKFPWAGTSAACT
jgi:hypothetical protein